VPLLWLIYRHQWLALAGYLVAVMGSSFALAIGNAGDAAGMLSGFAINFLLALQANDLRRWTLSRRGYRLVGLIFAPDLDQAEHKFFRRLLDGVRDMPGDPGPPPAAVAKETDRGFGSEPVLGLFPTSGAT